jgi:hypothetical protein
MPATTLKANCYGSMFKDCTSLTAAPAELPATDLTGDSYCYSSMFDGCKALEAIELPDGVAVVEDYTFRNCSAITTINLPVNIGKMGVEAFAGCTGLVSFTVNTYQPDRITLLDNVFDHVRKGKDLSDMAEQPEIKDMED